MKYISITTNPLLLFFKLIDSFQEPNNRHGQRTNT